MRTPEVYDRRCKRTKIFLKKKTTETNIYREISDEKGLEVRGMVGGTNNYS